MLQRRKSAFVVTALLFCITCAGIVWAKSAAVVGMVTETQGHAYWQNDSKKIHVQDLAELPENAKLVLVKGSRIVLVYLVSGQQYELNGPALVQFKNSKPVALSGTIPKTIGATPVLTDKKRIDPKSVQTAGQTLVSTETKADPNYPVVVSAPAPAPPPPPPAPAIMIAPSPSPDTIAAAEARKRIEASEAAAKRSVEAEMMAARQAEMSAQQARTAESASLVAEREAAKAAAAKSAERNAEKKVADPRQEPECLPQAIDADSVQPEVGSCDEIKN